MIYLIPIIIIIAIILIINFFIRVTTKKQIITNNNFKIKDIDCIIVMGAGIRENKPTFMLEDRLLESINLYRNGLSKKILMTGDHGNVNYDEVNVMKKFAVDRGVPSEDIFMDHAGFSSYDSMYRAKSIFNIKKAIIVTQKYHLYRTLYIANKFNIKAYGVPSNPRKYIGSFYRELREILARNKDFIKCIFKPYPKYLGDKIDISGNGNVTNDKDYINITK